MQDRDWKFVLMVLEAALLMPLTNEVKEAVRKAIKTIEEGRYEVK